MRSFRRREKRSVVWVAPPRDSVMKGMGSQDLGGELSFAWLVELVEV